MIFFDPNKPKFSNIFGFDFCFCLLVQRLMTLEMSKALVGLWKLSISQKFIFDHHFVYATDPAI